MHTAQHDVGNYAELYCPFGSGGFYLFINVNERANQCGWNK